MKQVLFVRHAKSSWTQPELMDRDRPLNNRGRRDAPFMAKVVQVKEEMPEIMLVSSARRTMETADHFISVLDMEETVRRERSDLYHAMPETVLTVLSEVEDDIDRVMLFGHNPTMTILANNYSDTAIDNVPTCGVFRVDFDIEKWEDIYVVRGRLKSFHYPKQYFT